MAAGLPISTLEHPTAPVLEAKSVSTGYHGNAIVTHLDLKVHPGEVVALLGANGAGKTTTLLTLAGHLPLIAGEVCFDGNQINGWPGFKRARAGLAFVPESRSVFSRLSTRDNLRVGNCDIDRAVALFPELKPLLGRRGGNLSGGEQQMLTLGRAVARSPKLLLADELSLGLAPLVVQRLLDAVRSFADSSGIGVLIVEQHVHHALRIADRVYVMRRGEIVLSGTPDEVAPRIESAYL